MRPSVLDKSAIGYVASPQKSAIGQNVSAANASLHCKMQMGVNMLGVPTRRRARTYQAWYIAGTFGQHL